LSTNALKSFAKSSVGKKYLMGITGLVWAGFVFVHMAGNLLILVGADAFNSYGHAIITGPLLYPAEAILILSLIVHVGLAIRLTIENRRARGAHRYAIKASGGKAVSLASQTMAVQGSLLLFFIVSHIATFKYGTYYETTVNGVVMRDLHRLVVECFKQPGFLVFYVVALLILGFHLKHGVNSIFQSFGLREDKYAGLFKKIGLIYGIVVAGGFIIQPIYVYFIVGS
jgi:succinate dehydrogenase / fumarate reductase cytochrome b subunit